jgi:hypothetical protein
MNFMILPNGDLKLNSPMTDSEKEVAGKFVDELKKLEALQPAEGELLANCPFFCMDKLLPGDKRCIADCKRGGQNACMGKDPTSLVRNENILPRLWETGRRWPTLQNSSITFLHDQTSGDTWAVHTLSRGNS